MISIALSLRIACEMSIYQKMCTSFQRVEILKDWTGHSVQIISSSLLGYYLIQSKSYVGITTMFSLIRPQAYSQPPLGPIWPLITLFFLQHRSASLLQVLRMLRVIFKRPFASGIPNCACWAWWFLTSILGLALPAYTLISLKISSAGGLANAQRCLKRLSVARLLLARHNGREKRFSRPIQLIRLLNNTGSSLMSW